MRKHLGRLSEDVVDLFMRRAADGAIAPRDLGNVFESLRPLGTEAVRVIFGRAMERRAAQALRVGTHGEAPREGSSLEEAMNRHAPARGSVQSIQ